MRRFMNRLAIVSLIGLPIAAATVTLPAGAASQGVHFKFITIHSAVSPAKIPNSNIVGNGKKATYSPAALKAKEDTSGNNCSPFVTNFTITNTGTKTAYLAIDGTPVNYGLPAGDQTGVCSYGFGAGATETFGLANAAGTKVYSGLLTVTYKD